MKKIQETIVRFVRSLCIAYFESRAQAFERAAATARRFARDTYLLKRASHLQRMAALDAWTDASNLAARAEQCRDRIRELIHG